MQNNAWSAKKEKFLTFITILFIYFIIIFFYYSWFIVFCQTFITILNFHLKIFILCIFFFLQRPLRASKILAGHLQGQNCCHNNTKIEFIFLHSFSTEYIVESSRGYTTWDMATDWMRKKIWELSFSIKPDIKRTYKKCKTMIFLSPNLFLF